jgi:uncharacterized protein YbaR (Trm112 family)
VLEVGGGQSPHPRADVVVDKYVADSLERSGEEELDFSKPLVVADGHRLPFADRSISYSIAIHVLEHATDPARFASELSRVSPAGFVQVPTARSELTFGWAFHPWLIERSDGTLVFTPKGEQRAPYGEFFHESFSASPWLRLWWAAHRSDWFYSVEWRGHLDVEVRGSAEAEQSAVFDVDETVRALEGLAGKGAIRAPTGAVTSALRCPVCLRELELREGEASCTSCGRVYPVAAGVPILLEEAATAPS